MFLLIELGVCLGWLSSVVFIDQLSEQVCGRACEHVCSLIREQVYVFWMHVMCDANPTYVSTWLLAFFLQIACTINSLIIYMYSF